MSGFDREARLRAAEAFHAKASGDEQGAALTQGRIEALDADEPKVTRSV